MGKSIILSVFLCCLFSLFLYGWDDVRNERQNGLVIPVKYRIKPDDTIESIAEKSGESVYAIVYFNHIEDLTLLKPDMLIDIPKEISMIPVLGRKSQPSLPRKLPIKSDIRMGYAPLRVYFFSVNRIDNTDYKFVWDFNDKTYGFGGTVMHLFPRSGRYLVKLKALDKTNNVKAEGHTEVIVLEKTEKNLERWDLKAENGTYVTVDSIGSIVNLKDKIYDKYGNKIEIDFNTKIRQKPKLLKQIGYDTFKATDVGFSRFDVLRDEATYTLFIFVSPFPSTHCKETEFNWYKTQFGTGMYGNCGPAVAAMAIHWAKSMNVTVEEVREDIGMPIKSGAVNLEHLYNCLVRFKVKAYSTPINRPKDFFDIIDRGNLAMISFNTTYIRKFHGDKVREFTDRYYPDTTGHYTIIKGYSNDKKYMIVYDPIPGDWAENEARYLDGVSMIGRNRYFTTEDIMKAHRHGYAVEVERD
ncbi:MAG: C39 family peptidase [Spirochaetales bacterium]|nr:C39 family peptidase [Spirochaetales bacterium]